MIDPKALSNVVAPVIDPADPTKRVDVTLPMVDPHELLDYLIRTERVAIDQEDIRPQDRIAGFLERIGVRVVPCKYVIAYTRAYMYTIYIYIYNTSTPQLPFKEP